MNVYYYYMGEYWSSLPYKFLKWNFIIVGTNEYSFLKTYYIHVVDDVCVCAFVLII